MTQEQRKPIEDKPAREKIRALLEKRGSFEEQGMKRDLFIADTGTHKIGVDIFGEKPIVGVFLNNKLEEEGHGVEAVYALRDQIMVIWDKEVSKEQPAPKEYTLRHPPGDTIPEPVDREKLKEVFKKIEEKTPEPKPQPKPKTEKEMKKMEEKKEEKGLVPQETAKPPVTKKQMTDAERDNQIELAKAKRFLEGRGTSYKVQGKERPDAHKIQQIANERAISIEIISAVQTDAYSDIVVRGHLGEQFVDACVHHDFNTEYMLKTMEIIKKNPEVLDHYEGTHPVIKEGATIEVYEDGKTIRKDAKYYLVHALLSFKKFSLRDARTKAASIAEAMLLNRDWRDEDEVQSELSERAIVEETIKNSQKGK